MSVLPTLSLGEALRQGVRLLEDARVAAPRLTAEVLLCHALHRDRAYLYAHPEYPLADLEWIHYGRYLHERIAGKPTQYITGEQEFYGRPFRVSPAVLIPRPETEHVVEAVQRVAPAARDIADIGCGSGAIAVSLALEMPAARVRATDISFDALLVAAANARRNQARVDLVQCDLCAAIGDRRLDVLASNPPYVPFDDKSTIQAEVRDWEPEVALYGGPTGLEIYRRLIPEARRVLRPGGWLVLELGFTSLAPVRAMLGGWLSIEAIPDLAGIPRVLAAQAP
jgi:release factor glutamine methyltransferase